MVTWARFEKGWTMWRSDLDLDAARGDAKDSDLLGLATARVMVSWLRAGRPLEMRRAAIEQKNKLSGGKATP